MDMFEILKFKKNNAVGWVNQTSLYYVDFYRHIEFFTEDHPDFIPSITKKWNDFEDYLNQEMHIYSDSIPDGEHPEWHNFEIWKSNEQSDKIKELYSEIYKNRWARIGTYSKNGVDYLEVSTSRDSQYYVFSMVTEIAEMLNREIKWNILKT
jgi:hypothetical protein